MNRVLARTMSRRILPLLASAVGLASCAGIPARPPTNGELAADHASAYCRNQGYVCDVVAVQSEGPVWFVDLDVSSEKGQDRMQVEYDMRGWKLLRAEELPETALAQ